MNFSVIVPAYQAAQHLPRCLSALQQQTIDRAQYEIIVIDDGSTDGTADVAEQALCDFPVARIIRAEHSGPAGARNLGVQAAQGNVVVSPMPTANRRPGWIEHFARAFADPSVSGAKGTMPRGSNRWWRASCSRSIKSVTITPAASLASISSTRIR
jgi:cellulose synthase/poly-beta-1,6-N-acetylglucosamine synthase-like glycosyltransferase